MTLQYTIKDNPRSATVEFLPTREVRLSTKNIVASLIRIGYELITETPFVIVAKREQEVTVFPSGKIIMKNISNTDLLEQVVDEIYSVLVA